MQKSVQKITTGAVVTNPGSTIVNKTGNWRTNKPIINREKCIKCKQCWQCCPDNVISEEIDFNFDYCKGCGICSNVCPVKAIEMKRER